MRFGGDRIKVLMDRFGWEEGVSIDGRMVSHSIETAQKRVEAFHFESRKYVTEYDDVMNKQRQVVYNMRTRILRGEGVREEILEMVDDLLEHAVTTTCDTRAKPLEWDLSQISKRLSFLFNTDIPLPNDIQLDPQIIFDKLRERVRSLYEERVNYIHGRLSALDDVFERVDKSEENGTRNKAGGFFDFEQHTLLETVDHLWNLHLQQMDHLREGIGLRGYGQKNPLHEYQKEGFILFQQFLDIVRETVTRKLFFYEVPTPEELMAHLESEKRRRLELEKQMQLIHSSPSEGVEVEENSETDEASKDLDEERARLLAQKKARRKAKR